MKTNKIAFVIDGYFGFTLYKNIKGTYGKIINFEGLVNSVCETLGNVIDEKCISPANLRHYYMGTDLGKINAERNEYENALRLARFGARGRPLQNGKEKGIDTMLYSDIKDEANSGSFDYLVLLAGDLDHITLIQDLKTMGIKTVLLYGEIVTNGVKTTGCSSDLKDECYKVVDLFGLIDDHDIFKSANIQTNSMTELMKQKSPNLLGGMVAQRPMKISSNGISSLLKSVIDSVNQVISKKELLQGCRLAFALQAQVGTQLKNNGIALPVPLREFLESYPTVFKTGTHPLTKALTVSVR